MVRTTDDVRDINPLERMDKLEEINSEKKSTIASKKKEFEELERTQKKEIEELENKKRKELDELENRKRRELDTLDKKRKELQEMESKKLKEIEETQDLIEKSFQELMRHKRMILQEEDEKKVSKAKEVNLEEVANASKNTKQDQANASMNYSKFFEELQTPQRFYDITNNTFYNGLAGLRDKAATGQITPEEELFVDRLREQFEQFTSNQAYVESDQNNYMKRSMNIIEQIGTYRKLNID